MVAKGCGKPIEVGEEFVWNNARPCLPELPHSWIKAIKRGDYSKYMVCGKETEHPFPWFHYKCAVEQGVIW